MPRNESTDPASSRKERARERRKAFRSVNMLWFMEITTDRDHERARRFLRLKYKN